MSLLVVIEGIDGSGKGTQAARLRERLLARGLVVGSLSSALRRHLLRRADWRLSEWQVRSTP